MTRLALIVPVYNVEPYIKECLDSILAQNYSDFKVLCIDDGSSDRSGIICDEYAKKDSRINVIHQENRGVCATRNRGILLAETEFIGFIDPDDFILPEMLSDMMNECIQGGDIVICDYQTFMGSDTNHLVLKHQNVGLDWSTEKIRDEFLLDNFPNFLCNKIFKRALFEGLSMPTDITVEDLYISAELFARAKKIVFVPKGFYCYRQHASFASTLQKTRRKLGMFVAWAEHERVCKKYDLKPLQYSRMRAQKSAIGLKTLNLAQPYISKEREIELDEYIANIDIEKSELPLKQKVQLLCIQNGLDSVCKLMGKISIYTDSLKQKIKYGK